MYYNSVHSCIYIYFVFKSYQCIIRSCFCFVNCGKKRCPQNSTFQKRFYFQKCICTRLKHFQAHKISVIVVVIYNYYVCECTVGVDVGDGTTRGEGTISLMSILSTIAMGCIVLGRQMNVYFARIVGQNTITFVGMDVRFCTMKIHDSIII